MSENEINVTETLLEILQRITRVETKIDGYNNLKDKLSDTRNIADDAKDAIVKHCKKHDENWTQTRGLMIGSICTMIISILCFIFLK